MSSNVKKLSGFAIFSILLLPMLWNFETATVGVALGSISLAFPGESTFKLQLLNVAPFITSVIFCIVSGKLANIISKKTIAIIGLLIYAVSGILPAFLDNVTLMIAVRFITGIGVGLIMPIPNQLIVENFEGKKREKMLGFVTAAFYFACIAVSVIVGLLIQNGWQIAFYTFGFVFIILIIAIIGLPKSPALKAEESKEKKEKVKIPKYTYGMFASNFFIWIIYGGFAVTLSMFITLEKVAPVTAIGIMMSVPAVSSMIAGIFFPFLKRIFGKSYVFVALLCYGLGYVSYVFAHGVGALIIGSLLIGVGTGFLHPFIIYMTSLHVTEKEKDAALGLVSAGQHLGGFGGAFLISFIMSLVAVNQYRFTYSVLAVVLIAGGVISLIISLLKKEEIRREN